MSKKSNAAVATTDRFAKYEKLDDDEFVKPAGYWQPALGAIHGKLIGAYQFRQKTGRSKGQLRIVYLFDLAEACPAQIMSENGNGKKEVTDGELQAREICAVFGTHGMRVLKNRAGSFIRMVRKPQKRTLPNGNEMWEYDMSAYGPKGRLEIREPLDADKRVDRDTAQGDDDDTDDLPF